MRAAGSNPGILIADNGGTTARLPEQAKVVQEPVRADLAAGHTRLRPADAYAPGRDAGRFKILLQKFEKYSKLHNE